MMNQTRDHLLVGAITQRDYVLVTKPALKRRNDDRGMLTLKNTQVGGHITYRVEAADDLRHWLVYHLVDGGLRRPVHIGWIRRRDLVFRPSNRTPATGGHRRAVAVWWWTRTAQGTTAPGIEVWAPVSVPAAVAT